MRHPDVARSFAQNGPVCLFPPQLKLLLRPFYSRNDKFIPVMIKGQVAVLLDVGAVFPVRDRNDDKELWLSESCPNRLG
jgi:hypothetical protein